MFVKNIFPIEIRGDTDQKPIADTLLKGLRQTFFFGRQFYPIRIDSQTYMLELNKVGQLAAHAVLRQLAAGLRIFEKNFGSKI